MKMKRNLILILMILMLLPMALAGCNDFLPRSPITKAEIEEAYKARFGGFFVSEDELPAWYDENGGQRDNNVFRNFGTYGDCLVLLRYYNHSDGFGWPIDPPYMLRFLSRPVEYPVQCDIWLYNTNRNYPRKSNNPKYADDTLASPLSPLKELAFYEITWLTDEELEQLTTDLENWLAEGNY